MTPTRARRWWAAALTALTMVTTICQVMDLSWAGRPLLTLAFFVLVPGSAIAGRHRLEDLLSAVTLGVALSLAIGTAVASAMLVADRWQPGVAQIGLAVVSLPLLVAQVRTSGDGGPWAD